jgi:arylsulfatase A-like enzyme
MYRPVNYIIPFIISLLIASFGFAGTGNDKPNILWLTSEDNNVTWVGCYGNPHADTPNIDALAKEGFRYEHCYANVPVCAPQRSTWITGVYSLSMGTHPMRSRNEIPHDRIKYYPDLLKANGYYVGNSTKTDYNIGGRDDKEPWDNAGKVKWEDLKKNQPFFQIVNSTSSHESKAFGDVTDTIHDPDDIQLKAYHPDLPGVRGSYAKYHDAVKRMDSEIGESLKKLEELGLADNTIVIYNSDHGGVLPRSKRFLFSSGIHCPLIVRIPEKYKHLYPAKEPGSTVDRIVSFIDMPKTWLSLTGTEVPGYMQGDIFLGKDKDDEKDFHFAFRGRMDERNENARAVFNKRYVYIRNYMPYVPWMQYLEYLFRQKATQAWAEHVESGKATEVQARFFKPKGFTMRKALREWQLEIHDSGLLPESEMVKRAKDNGLTIYDMVRDPKLYNLPALLDAADLALEQDKKNLPKLKKLMGSDDSGLRYWGIVGCFLLDDASEAYTCLNDESHEVRAMAAWLLVRSGHKAEGLECLMQMIEEKSYATLKVLNIIDWLGTTGEELIPLITEVGGGNYERNALKNLQAKLK